MTDFSDEHEGEWQESDELEDEFLDHYPTKSDVPRLTRKWLATRSKDELIDLVLHLVARLPTVTSQLSPDATPDSTDVFDFDVEEDTDVRGYIRLPAQERGHASDVIWRV